jgi:hypothetical protein
MLKENNTEVQFNRPSAASLTKLETFTKRFPYRELNPGLLGESQLS